MNKNNLEIRFVCTILGLKPLWLIILIGDFCMFKPLNNYVLMERIQEDNKTAGGIIIPDNAKEKPVRGRVIAVGDGEMQNGNRVPMTVSVGDVVMFAKWAASINEVKIDGQDYVLIKESDILGILK